jgi:hypothetical protein
MIGLRLGTHLNTKAAVLNRLSNRIYPNRVPQKEKDNYPRSIITTIGGNPDYSLSGPISDISKTVQVDVDAYSQKDADEIAELIRAEIEFSPTVSGNQTWGDAKIGESVVLSCTVQNERDQSFQPQDASDRWIFRRSIDYRVTYVR